MITSGIGFDLSTLPVVGGVVQWAQDTARGAIEWLMSQVAAYRATKVALPAAEAKQRAVAMLDLAPSTRTLVAQWGAELAQVRTNVSRGDGAVARVTSWFMGASSSGQLSGLSAWPLIPLAILGVLALAILTVRSVSEQWSTATRTEALVSADLTPAQIAKTLGGGGGFGSWFAGMGTAAWALLAFMAYQIVRGKRT